MKKKKTIKIKNVVLEIPVAVMLIILTLLVLVPVIWMVFSAFKPEKEINFVAAYILYRIHLLWKTLQMYRTVLIFFDIF